MVAKFETVDLRLIIDATVYVNLHIMHAYTHIHIHAYIYIYIHRSGIISATDGRRAAVCSRLDLFVDQRESSCDHSHTSDARDCAVHNAGLAAVPIIVIDCTLDCRRPTDYLDRLSLVVLTIGVDYRWLAGLTIVRLTFDYRTHYTTLFFMCTSTPHTIPPSIRWP